MPFVSDNFIVDVVVSRIPSITIPDEFATVTTIPGATPSVGFYYDGGVGVNAGKSFELHWASITPSNQPQTEPTLVSFSPPAPVPGRPIAQNIGGSIAPATVQGNIFNAGQAGFYWWGSCSFTMPTGQTARTRYSGEVRINY